MWRRTTLCASTALHNNASFIDGALQLIKLHLAHRNAVSDANTTACGAIEEEFLREVESFRPCFTLASSLSVEQRYSKQLYAALRYFGLDEDPLARQLRLIMGREGMRRASAQRTAGMFKGVRPAATGQPSRGPTTDDVWVRLQEATPTTLPTELPNPPRVDLYATRRAGAVHLPLHHRGHWVLQEPEVAITRRERREDPW